MANFLTLLLFVTIILLVCPAQAEDCGEIITYQDRNSDGNIDQELHQYPCMADADWELLDQNYDDRYDTKILYCIGPIKSKINLPIHKGKTSHGG